MLAAASCGPAKDRFVLEGSAADSLATLAGSQVIVRYQGQLDTIAINDGKFSYEGSADATESLLIRLDYPGRGRRDVSHQMLVIPEGGKTLKVTLADSSFVNGSPLTDKLTALTKDINDAAKPFEEELRAAYYADDDEKYDAAEAKMNEAIAAVCKPAIKENITNYVGKFALTNIMDNISATELQEYVDLGGDAFANDKNISRVLRNKKAEESTAAGQNFVDFAGKTLDGKDVKLSDYVGKGEYVLIDFWASWCGPCMAAMPELRETYLKYSKKGLKVIGVNVWERQEGAGEKCVKDKDMIWDIMLVKDNSATDAYGVQGIPTAVIFGPDGKIVKRGHPMSIKPSEFFAEIYK